MPQLERPGASIHYEMLGTGPPLLLLAGIASDGASWGPLLPLLQGRYQLILMDNRGAGQTTSEGDFLGPDMVEDCVALLDHLGLPEAFVVGHSMGGMLGQRLAASHPGRVKALVTMCCSDRIGPKERVLFQDMAKLYVEMAPRPKPWFRLLFQWLFSDTFFESEKNVEAAADASVAYTYRQSPKDFARQVRALEQLPEVDLRAIRCPVLAIAAEEDLLILPEVVEAGHQGIADLRLVPRHRGFDWLIFGHFRMGKFSGATRSSMLRATPGWRRIRPARSRVSTIW